jgi:hypothetical protein
MELIISELRDLLKLDHAAIIRVNLERFPKFMWGMPSEQRREKSQSSE